MASLSQKTAPKNFTFCISKCTQVPPITIDHVDMATVMKLFSSFRSEVRLLSSSNVRISERLTKIEKEKETVPLEEVNTIIGKNGLSEQDVIEMQERLLKQYRPQPKGKKNTSFSDVVKEKPRQRPPSPPTPKSKSRHEYSDVLSSSEETGEDDKGKDGGFQLQRWQRKKQKRHLRKEDEETIQQNKPKNVTRKGIVIGSSEGTGLLAADPMTNMSLFVSRLQPSVLEEDLKKHIIDVSGSNKITCEKLTVKHENYVSFKIVIGNMQKNRISTVFQPENWPKGIIVKKWYEKKISNTS